MKGAPNDVFLLNLPNQSLRKYYPANCCRHGIRFLEEKKYLQSKKQ